MIKDSEWLIPKKNKDKQPVKYLDQLVEDQIREKPHWSDKRIWQYFEDHPTYEGKLILHSVTLIRKRMIESGEISGSDNEP